MHHLQPKKTHNNLMHHLQPTETRARSRHRPISPPPPARPSETKKQLMKERMWYRLVGSSLEVYDVKTKEDEPLYVVTEAPIEVWEVKGIARMSAINFRVTVLAGPDGGLNLFAADEVDGQGWMDALTRAMEWDQMASTSKVRACVRTCVQQIGRCSAFVRVCRSARACVVHAG